MRAFTVNNLDQFAKALEMSVQWWWLEQKAVATAKKRDIVSVIVRATWADDRVAIGS